MTDLARIADHHKEIDQRCCEWAKWVKVAQRPFGAQPMFRHYRTPRQWDIDPHIPQTLNTLAALEVERAVALLPAKQRTVLRWAYVWPALHINAVARELGTDRDGLGKLRDLALCELQRGLIICATTGE